MAMRGHSAAMALDQAAYDGKTKPESAMRTIDRLPALHEDVEDMREDVWGHTNAGVLHAQHHLIELSRCRDRNFPPRRRVLARVGQEIGEDLCQPLGVPMNRKTCTWHMNFHRMRVLLEK